MILETLIHSKTLLFISIIPYWLAWAALLKMALESHTNKVKNKKSHIYPDSYFFWLIIQLIPLILAGVAREDPFILATRIPLFICVLLAFTMVKDTDGIFQWKEYGMKLMFLLVSSSLFFMIWMQFPIVQEYLVSQKAFFAYSAMVAMALYLIFGQGSTIAKLWKRYSKDQTRMRGLDLQVWRFSGFFIPAIHYGFAYGPTDAFFLKSLIGSIGAFVMIALYSISKKG
ncbi:hypothetical protein ACFL96_15305 [Thermoproteota archaeon]